MDLKPYTDKLSSTDQVDTEEQIAAMIFDDPDTETSEETASTLGKQILNVVLQRFRPDLIQETPKNLDPRGWTPGSRLRDTNGFEATLLAPVWNGWLWVLYDQDKRPKNVDVYSFKLVTLARTTDH